MNEVENLRNVLFTLIDQIMYEAPKETLLAIARAGLSGEDFSEPESLEEILERDGELRDSWGDLIDEL